MRRNRESQLPLLPIWPNHSLARELRRISRVLDQNPRSLGLVLRDLCGRIDTARGAPGMSAEQVLRCAIVKQMYHLSYQKLAFHLADSLSCRVFCRLPYGMTPSKSSLQENIFRIAASTWRAINRELAGWVREKDLQRRQSAELATAAAQRHLHYPLNRRVLREGFRTLSRPLRDLIQVVRQTLSHAGTLVSREERVRMEPERVVEKLRRSARLLEVV